MNHYDMINRFPSSLAIDSHPQPYNRMVSQPEPGLMLVEPIVTTKVWVAPSPKKFKKGDSVIVTDYKNEEYKATFLKKDGRDRSFISINGNVTSVYTYKLKFA